MTMPSWRFKSAHDSCVTEESGVNYTSHHLRCRRLALDVKHTTSRRQQQIVHSRASSSPWPGTASRQTKEKDYDSNSSCPQLESQLSHDNSSIEDVSSTRQSIYSTLSVQQSQTIRKPPLCRLPMSMRLTTLILHITISLLLLSSLASATPTPAEHSNTYPHRRQAIPDKSGNTGNIPGLVYPSSLSLPSVTPCGIAPGASFTYNPPSPKPTTLVPGNSGTTTPPGELGLNPHTPSQPLTLTSPIFPLTAGAIAGIAGGSAVLLTLIIAIGIWAYRRRRVDVNEIPIRRSKLVSRLGFRVFGDTFTKPASRSASRQTKRESQDSQGSKGSWLDKGTIGRPKPAWLSENGLLSVPKPTFLRQEKDDEGAPWVDKTTIGRPMPGRPRSAEPLGRLSGMGMGMGYLK